MKSREGVQEVIQEFFDTVDLSDFMKKHRKALCIKEGKYVLESYNDLNKDVSILYDSLVTYSKEFGSSPKLTVLPQEFDNYKSYFDFILSSSYADLFKNNYRKLVLISGKDGLSLAEMKENVVKSIYFEYITREGLSVVECIADDRVFNLRSGDDLRFFRNRKDETYTSSSFIEVLIRREKVKRRVR